jgi:hypothetical protein
MQKQTIVDSNNEIGMAGPACWAIVGSINTTLVAGAM